MSNEESQEITRSELIAKIEEQDFDLFKCRAALAELKKSWKAEDLLAMTTELIEARAEIARLQSQVKVMRETLRRVAQYPGYLTEEIRSMVFAALSSPAPEPK